MFPVLLAAASAAPAAAKAAAPAVKASAVPLTLPPNFNLGNLDVTPHSPLAQNFPWLTHTLAGLFVLLGVLLVALLAIQTTKQEGLSGTVGGRVESATRRLGLDAQIAAVTRTVAVLFVFVATLISLSGI